MSRPNIILFFTDQQRADLCGCNGSDLGLTPNLDALGSDGVVFKNAITNQPVCGPARSCLQSGMYATQNNCYRNALAFPDDGKTLAHQLANGGYTTNYIGKWHLSLTELAAVPMEKRCGYTGHWLAADLLEFTSDAYKGYVYDRYNNKVSFSGRYRSDVLTDYACDFVKDYSDDKPFFLMISYLEPHHQNDHNRYIAPDGYADKYRSAAPPNDLVALDKPDADWKANFADYCGCIKRLDENLGQLVQTLKDSGQYDNTIILFTSDHGSHFRTRNGEYKRSCHDASVHIPLVARGGGFRGGKVIDNPVALLDIPTTILHCAGITPDNQMVGRNLQELVSGAPDWDDCVYIQISESQVARAIRTPKWTYSVAAPHKSGWLDSASDLYVEECLYNLDSDPYQLDNLIADSKYAEVKAELKRLLTTKMLAAGEAAATIVALD